MWNARIVGVIVALVVCVILPFGVRVGAETVAWTNPSTYTDSTPIPAAKAAQLSTEIQYRIPPGAFTAFGSTTGGASSYAAPYVTPGGGTSYWRVRSISVLDNNATSAWSPDYPFVRGFQAPVAPQPVSVQ